MYNLIDDDKITNNNSNVIFVLLIFNYFIIFLLSYKYKFYEKRQNDINDELELLNKKYLYYDDCVEKLIIISNDTITQINTLNIAILNIKKNEILLKKQINDSLKINILEDKLNNEIEKINIFKEEETKNYGLLNEKINILEETLNFENGKINVIEEKLNSEIEKINIAIKNKQNKEGCFF